MECQGVRQRLDPTRLVAHGKWLRFYVGVTHLSKGSFCGVSFQYHNGLPVSLKESENYSILNIY